METRSRPVMSGNPSSRRTNLTTVSRPDDGPSAPETCQEAANTTTRGNEPENTLLYEGRRRGRRSSGSGL